MTRLNLTAHAHRRGIALAIVSLALTFVPGASAQTFSGSGFASELVTTLSPYGPISVSWAPDGRMFILHKNGIVRIFKNGALLGTPFLDFSSKVNTFNDNGMCGLTFDPNFSSNRFVYLTYVYEPGGNPNDSSPRIARLVRVTANLGNPDVMQAGSEVTLLDNLPVDYGTHTLGTIRFASDGTMFVGNGDGANPGAVDLNAFAAQDLDNVRGKMFRLNPDGSAPSDNPFYDGTDSVRSKVWCYGVRNPYRFSLHPVSGDPYIADVGWNDWEEIDHVVRGGNYGWPCYEGVNAQPGYQGAGSQCASVTSSIPPILNYSHSNGELNQVGTCLVGGDFYTGTQYPQAYQGNYFYADYSGNWIHRAILNANGNLVSNATFASGISGPTCVEQGPDGLLYYVAFPAGQIRRIRYNGPVAVATATPTYGYSSLPVSFSSVGSTNPGGGSLTYSWNFGDGTTSTQSNPSHTYTSAVVTAFTARLTVQNSSNQTSSATVKITVGSTPPHPTISTPPVGAGFMPGQAVLFQGSATDPDDGSVPTNALSWNVLLHHNTHVHTEVSTTGSQGSFEVENHGPVGTFFYEIVLTATDTSGLSASTNRNVTTLQDSVPPTAPANLVATPLNGAKIKLIWNASSDNAAVHDYLVERQSPGSTNFVEVGSSTVTNFTDTGLLPATNYNYRVRAVDASDNLSPYSNVAGATTPAGIPGLVAAYAFDEGAGTVATDASGNGHTGTITSATWTNAGRYGNALVFNGTSALITINDAASLRLTTGMTLQAWVYPTSTANVWRDVIYKGNDNYYFEARSPSGQPAIGGTFSGSPLYGTANLTANAWSHLAATYDNATIRLYVNGTNVASHAQTGAIATSTNPLQIGGNNLYGQYFQGRIDEVRVYNRALGAAEILSDMNTPVTSTPSNTPPTISTVANQTINEDTVAGPIGFTVGDVETPATNLIVSGVSSNQTLVPNGNIVFGGGGTNRTVTVTPVANQNGTTLITVTVSDGSLSSNRSFLVTVNAVNDTPAISAIGNQVINEDTVAGPIGFTVGDVETAAGSLSVSGISSNQTLVPNGNILFGGSGTNRTVTVTPAGGETGTTLITVTVSDGSLSSNTTFTIAVTAPPVLPPFIITSITLSGDNDVNVVWNARQGTNVIQASTGDGSGDFTGAYLDLASNILTGAGVTNYTDTGGATNSPSRYYRIRLIQP